MRRIALALSLLALALSAAAQTPPAATTPPVLADPFALAKPEPYAPGEVPGWLSDLHRFETVSIGSFPFAFFFTSFAFDSVRFFSSSMDGRYAPWPFKDASSIDMTQDQKLACLLTSIGVSLVVGLIDYLIRDSERRAAEADAARRAAVPAEVPPPAPAEAPPADGGAPP